MTDPTGTYGFSFDNMGRLTGTSTQYAFLNSRTFTNAYSYDAASNRTGYTDPESGATSYAYDTLNRLTDLTDFGANHFTFGYDALSRRTQLTRPNGINTNYTYDNLSRLLSVLHQAGASTVDGASYTYDNAGNRTSKLNYLNSVTENYSYDAIYQLTQVVQGANTTEAYTYDLVGNRLSTMSDSGWTYNSSNQLTSRPGVSYTYDNNGNTLTKTDSSGTTSYAWDFENRLTSVTLPSQSQVTFKYDPFGRRIQKASVSGTTNYAYDGANVVEEVDRARAVQARYAQGAGIDEPLDESTGGATSSYAADGLGSITSLSSSAGALTDNYVRDAFGKSTSSTGTTRNPYRYTGREWDAENGLYYYRARYHDPSTGRFLSEDPIRFRSGTVNFFAYADSDPVNEIDPSGLRTQVCCRPLRGAGGRLTGKNHCYVLITSEDDQQQFHTYGLHREDANNVKYPSGARPVMDDPTDVGGTCADVPDATPCKERQFAQQSMSNTNCPSCGPNYWFLSTNSNYWVWDALTQIGMTPPVFPGGNNSPGYGPLSPPPYEPHVIK